MLLTEVTFKPEILDFISRGRVDLRYGLHWRMSAWWGEGAPKPWHARRIRGDDGETVQVIGYVDDPLPDLTGEARRMVQRVRQVSVAARTTSAFDAFAAPTRRYGRAERNLPVDGSEPVEWLAERMRALCPDIEVRASVVGAEECTVHVRTQASSSAAREVSPIKRNLVHFRGVLRAPDEAGTLHILRHGVGRQRVFGFGAVFLR